MKIFRQISFLLFALFLFVGTVRAEGSFQLKDGDCVVFYGDSITDGRGYTSFTETYAVTRFPHLRLRFVHSGWGGDRVTGGAGGSIDARLRRDVLAHKPTVMTIMLGMNDGGYRHFDPALFKTYTDGYQHIIDTVKSVLPGIRITLLQPSPFDDVTRPAQFEGGYNAVLIRYGQFVKELGRREGSVVADLNTPVVAALEKAKATDVEKAKRIISDRVHPGPAGSLLLAEALLKAWNAPAIVTSVEIDAPDQHLVRAENTTVTGLEFGKGLSWTQRDKVLPMPIDWTDDALALAVHSSDFVQALDQQPLKVRGLTAARYTLKIDDEEVGTFTREKLQHGINLAVLLTPMAKQAALVHELTWKRGSIYFARWRFVQAALQDQPPAHLQAAIEALDQLETEVLERQRAAAQPKPHQYELIPQ